MSKYEIASGFAFGFRLRSSNYAGTRRPDRSLSLYLNRPFDTKAHDGRYALFDVRCLQSAFGGLDARPARNALKPV
jgi:hypothetical protein